MKLVAEYIWLDSEQKPRSKTKPSDHTPIELEII